MLQQVAFVQFFWRNYTQMNLFHTLECMDYCSIVVTEWVENRICIHYSSGGREIRESTDAFLMGVLVLFKRWLHGLYMVVKQIDPWSPIPYLQCQ